jgi:molybdopterin-guanine dinucleotide biosynthesis protein A
MGRPKAWLPFGDEVLLQRVVRRLRDIAGPIAVVSAPGQDLPTLPADVTVVHDPIEFRGPLQGIATGLGVLPPQVDLAYVTATDAPLLRPAWVNRLVGLIGDDDVAIPQVDGFLHPLAALYRRATVRQEAEALLAADRLRPVFLLERLRGRIVTPGEMADVDPGCETLRNLNTPEDYAATLAMLGLGPHPPTEV